MSDAHRDATELRLARVQGELARGRSRFKHVEQQGIVLRQRTHQLCSDLRAVIGSTRKRVLEAKSACDDQDRARNSVSQQRGDAVRGANRADSSNIVKLRAHLPMSRLRRVTEYIDAHLGEPIRVGMLAEIARMSPSHFSTLFRHSTGTSPHAYVLRRRMAEARTLLADDSLTLAEIGGRLGFSSQAHFTTAFRKYFGMTPSVFRTRERAAMAEAAD